MWLLREELRTIPLLCIDGVILESVMSNLWRDDSFTKGCRYKVKKDFKALRDSFFKDELLTYDHNAYSAYDSMSAFFFLDSDGKFRTWDINDNEDLNLWSEYFEIEN